MKPWRLGASLLPLIAVAAVVFICISNADDLATALDRVPVWVFGAATAAHLVVVVVRTEAWRVTLEAVGAVPPPGPAHWASAIGFLAGLVEGHAALPTRMAMARRAAPADTPGLREMALSDLPVYTIEACLLVLLVPIAALQWPGLPAWAVALAVLAPPATVVGLRLAHQRFGSHPLAAGLAVLGRRDLRARLTVQATALVVLTFVRIWLILWAVGLPSSAGDAAVAYVAVTFAGQLPLGPATGPAATLAVASSSGVAQAAAAGLVISATSIVAVLVYAAAATVFRRATAVA